MEIIVPENCARWHHFMFVDLLQNEKQNGRQKQNGHQIAKLIITHSFLELQSADFAWKFIWTVRTNFEKKMKKKWPPKNKMAAKWQN